MKSVINKAVTAASVIAVGASIFGSVLTYGADADKIIYINGVNGSDDNDGSSPEEAVSTFGKVKELATDPSVKEIHVTGEITVDSEDIWDMSDADKKPFVRESGYTGNFVVVKEGATLDLGNITFDGKSVGNSSSVIKVEKGATLNFNDGALIMNNINRDTGNKYTSIGGAVYVEGGTMNMTGGVIKDCYSVMGGGVGVIHAGTFNMSGGTITGNVAGQDNDHDAGGGGVFLGTSSSMNMSGGVISNNKSGYIGGGISMGIIGNSLVVSNPSLGYGDLMRFTMTGGTIIGNESYNTGGGLYVQCNSVADIFGGNFYDNSTLGIGSFNEFGGGAIYVNGSYDGDYGDGNRMVILPAGVLNTNFVNISENKAFIAGGGIAGCRTSEISLDVENGSVIFGNKANISGPDIFVSSTLVSSTVSNATSHYVNVSECMLSGAPYLWKNNKNLNVSIDKLKNVGSLELHNDYTKDDEAIIESLAMAKVNIVGNSSGTRGGGIGTNGVVRIGTVPTETVDIHAKKVWDDEESDVGDRPPVVKLWLVRDGERIVSQNVEKNKGWIPVTFKDQPIYDWLTGKKYEYSIEEDLTWFGFTSLPVTGRNVFEKYDPQVSEDPDVENGFIVTNPIKRDIEISKTVVNEVNPDDDKKFEFTIEIKDPEGNPYEDMVFIVSPDSSRTEVTLTDGKYVFELGNGEKLTIKGLKTGSTYTVTETEDKNYKTTANEEAGTQYSGTIERLCNAEVKYENTYTEEETTTTTEEETTEEETTEEETTTTEEETTSEEETTTTEEETTSEEETTTTEEETTSIEETTTTEEETTSEEETTTTEEETTTTEEETTSEEETTTTEEETTSEEETTTTEEETTSEEETTTTEEETTSEEETTTTEEETTTETIPEETATVEPTETETATETEAIKETAEELETTTDAGSIIEESEEIKDGEPEEDTESSEVATASESESSESSSSETVILEGGRKPSGGVNTGDGNNMAVLVTIACASAAGLAATVAIAGKKKKDNE